MNLAFLLCQVIYNLVYLFLKGNQFLNILNMLKNKDILLYRFVKFPKMRIFKKQRFELM